jgi:hypothetical protein
MNGGYLLLRRKRKVRGEAALLLLGYNIKRAKSALGFTEIMRKLDEYRAVLGNNISLFLKILFSLVHFRNLREYWLAAR